MNRDVELRIAKMAGQDTFYRELLKECENLSSDYHRIRSVLQASDREILDRYIALCEELEHQRGRMAYVIGTQDGMRTGTALLRAE